MLSIWTACLHMFFSLLGYFVSDLLVAYFSSIATLLSIILLFCIGLHLLFSTEMQINDKITPALLAISVSLDTFSVSLSFGILNLHKQIFIGCAGLSAFICSYTALHLSEKFIRCNGKYVNRLVGIILITISIWNFMNLK